MEHNELIELHNWYVERAKDCMKGEGALTAFACIVGDATKVQGMQTSMAKKTGKTVKLSCLHGLDDPAHANCVPRAGEDHLLLVSMEPSAVELFEAICFFDPECEESMRAAVTQLANIGDTAAATRLAATAYLRARDIEPHHIAAKMISMVADQVSASAVLMVTEAYARVATTAELENGLSGDRPLAEDPEAKEAIMVTLETHEFTRMIIVEVKHEGEAISFGDPVITTDRDCGLRFVGNMVRLLRPKQAVN